MLRLPLLLVPLGLALLPGLAGAQGQGSCDLDRSRALVAHNHGTPQEITYIGGPVLSCPNNMRITADSAVFARVSGQIRFLGSVRFTDPLRRLTSDYAQYMIESRHVAAQGNVVLIDSENGSTIQAPTLDYFMQSPARPEPRIEVYRGRPRTTLIGTRADGTPADTTIVDSDALTIVGESAFHGRGDVVLTRGAMRGAGQDLNYDPQRGSMRLTGSAWLRTEEYHLAGERITALLADDVLQEVTSVGDATLVSADIDVDAGTIHISFEAGEIERLVALGTGAEAGAADTQARVVSPDFRMIADSIDARAPAQQLEEVVAVGNAFAERLEADTLALRLVEEEQLPRFLAYDWVRGDTIVAHFVARPAPADALVAALAAAPDSVSAMAHRPAEDGSSAAMDAAPREERVLESLVVRGGSDLASTAYRMRNDAGDEEGFVINYMLARQIDVAFEAGEVKRVDAEGDVQGVHLRPLAQAPAAGRQR